jgi:transposase-like protein
MSRVYGDAEKKKLIRVIDDCVSVLQEIETLNEGMKDTIKAVAEELDIKPSLLRKAIKVAQKGSWDQVNNDFEELETIVVTAGKDS